ncbi:cell division protein FtsZ [gut metagenome]|uniref:Cell division protein FtsZ n=1 Tax=gut metagenome TaxID=749906 RepID=J9GDH3_9ZZZZ
MSEDLIELANVSNPSLIKIIGVGGGGGNAVGQMYRDNIPEVRYLVINSDSKALRDSPVPDQLQLGPGLGAGGDPVKGEELAEECLDQIKAIFDKDTKMVFITAGMGGGTGTGASPVIAREARKLGILTVGIVTIPFLFEREKQIDKALDGLERLGKEVDAMLVINNQRLCDIYPDMSVINAFKRADETLSTAVSSITEIISMHGRINLDFEDVRTVLTKGGVAVMSTGYAEGENRVTRAIEAALNSPLLNNNDVYNANRILLSITTSDDPKSTMRTNEIDEITQFMNHFPADIHTKWGFSLDRNLGEKIKVTILASGFGLYSKKNNNRAGLQENKQTQMENEKRNELRGRYYHTPSQAKRHPHIFLFSEKDLLNPQLLAQVEDTPTYLRTGEMLQYIRSLSTQN